MVLFADRDAFAGGRIAATAGFLTVNAPKPRNSTRSPRVSAAAISSKMAVTIISASRW
jgi:hypothetical protein